MQRAENKGSAVKTVGLIKCLFLREPNNGGNITKLLLLSELRNIPLFGFDI